MAAAQTFHKNRLPVVEVFSSIQGEGYHTGRASVFVRLAGCDLACNWCDSKASWSVYDWPEMEIETILQKVLAFGISSVIVTGGEPLTHDLGPLCQKLKMAGCVTYLETSGSYPLTGVWDWICLSPKKQSPPLDSIFMIANELKVVIEKEDDLMMVEKWSEIVQPQCIRYLQPEWSKRHTIIPLIISYMFSNPHWLLSLQSHKYIGIP